MPSNTMSISPSVGGYASTIDPLFKYEVGSSYELALLPIIRYVFNENTL